MNEWIDGDGILVLLLKTKTFNFRDRLIIVAESLVFMSCGAWYIHIFKDNFFLLALIFNLTNI